MKNFKVEIQGIQTKVCTIQAENEAEAERKVSDYINSHMQCEDCKDTDFVFDSYEIEEE